MPVRIVEFHRLALQELRRAVQWYAERSVYAASGFISELQESVRLIGESAEQYPVEVRNVRWRRLRKYNYVLYFLILDEDRCEVVAISHGRRRPRYWLRRLNHP
jgi:toxin ParE1/3/4